MKFLTGLLSLLTISLSLILPLAAQDATAVPAVENITGHEFVTRIDPVSLVGAYYNAISRGEYLRAYAYWEQPPLGQSQAQFEAGFADTLAASAIVRLPIFMDAGAGNVYASLPTLVVAYRHDGTQAYFAGCLTAHKTNVPVGNAPEPDPNWYLRDGSLRRQTTPDLSVLDTACEQSFSLISDIIPPSQSDPSQLLQSYFSAFAIGNGVAASAYWDNPPGDLFYPQFNTLLTTASAVNLYVNPVILSDAGAGNIFASIPALVTTTYPNGVRQFVVGCFTAHKSNVPVGNATEPDPNWYLRDMSMSQVTAESDAINILSVGCMTEG